MLGLARARGEREGDLVRRQPSHGHGDEPIAEIALWVQLAGGRPTDREMA